MTRKEYLADISRVSRDLDIEGLAIVLGNCYKERRRIRENQAQESIRYGTVLHLVKAGAAQ